MKPDDPHDNSDLGFWYPEELQQDDGTPDPTGPGPAAIIAGMAALVVVSVALGFIGWMP